MPFNFRIRQFLNLLLLSGITLLLFQACKKDETTNPPVVVSDSADPVQYETPFSGVPNTADIIMYEINERAFSSSGKLSGIIPRLDSIKSLHVNVIWLMPIFPIGIIKTVNSPYCIRNYTEVNTEFGNLNDLRTLVREAHKRDMAVILDWAANHTSWDNPWIKNRSWYTQDANGNIISPAGTNWQDVADLNFDNATMRKAMIKALKYWVLTANVDGYRCDAADYVPFDFWKQAIDSLNSIPGRKLIMLAEGARADHFTAGFQLNFGWDFFASGKDIFSNGQQASGFYQSQLTEYGAIPAGSHKLRFTSNHDECAWYDTPIGLYGGKEASMAAFAVTALMGGVPLVYNGQEVGCPVKLPFFSRSPISWATNPWMTDEYRKLLGARTTLAALRNGNLTYYPHNDVVAFTRAVSEENVLVLVNTRNAGKEFLLPTALQNSSWTDKLNGGNVALGNSVTLGAYEYMVLLKN